MPGPLAKKGCSNLLQNARVIWTRKCSFERFCNGACCSLRHRNFFPSCQRRRQCDSRTPLQLHAVSQSFSSRELRRLAREEAADRSLSAVPSIAGFVGADAPAGRWRGFAQIIDCGRRLRRRFRAPPQPVVTHEPLSRSETAPTGLFEQSSLAVSTKIASW